MAFSEHVIISLFLLQKYEIVVELLNEKSTAAEDARRRAEELKNSANKLAFEALGKLNSLRGS